MLGGPPQCCANEATLVPSWQGHLCKTIPTALAARLFQGSPGATIRSSGVIPGQSQCHHPSEDIPVPLFQQVYLSAVPVKPVPADHAAAIPVRTVPVMPAAAPSQRGHPGAITTRLILIHHTARPSQCHHPSKASPCCPGEINPGAVLTRPSQCHSCTASTGAIIPVKLSRCHHPGKAIPVLFQ